MHIQYNAIHNQADDSVTIYRGVVKLNDLDESIVWEEYLYIKNSDAQVSEFVESLFKNAGAVPIVLRVKDVELEYEDSGEVCICDNVIVSLPKNTGDDYKLQFPARVIVGRPNEDHTEITETNSVTNKKQVISTNALFTEVFSWRIPVAFREDCALVYICDGENATDVMLAYKKDIPVVVYK